MAEPVHIALLSYSAGQAEKNLLRIRKKIEETPWLQWLLPKSKSYVWDKEQLQLSNGCEVSAFGFGSSIRGGHYHHILGDDCCKDRGAGSMTLEDQINFFYGAVWAAVRRGCQLAVTGNVVEKVDFLANLEENPKFSKFYYPAIGTPASGYEGQPLWPEQYSLEDLADKRDGMPIHKWEREYMLRRVSEADAKFRPEWIEYYAEADLWQDVAGGRAKRGLYKVMTIDPSLAKDAGDPIGVVATGTDVNDNTYVLDRASLKGGLHDAIEHICDMVERVEPDVLGSEDFAFQAVFRIWLQQALDRRNLPYTVVAIGKDSRQKKAGRIEALQPKLAQHKLYFKKEHAPLVNQLLLWDPNSKKNRDDEIDALAWQVPLWQRPGSRQFARRRAMEGTLAEAMTEIEGRTHSDHWLSKLFEDMSHA